MITPSHTAAVPRRSDRLDGLPLDTFIARWRGIVGEPPVAMLACRSEMIRILVQSVPVAVPITAVSQADALA